MGHPQRSNWKVMTRAELTIDLPDRVWVAQVSQEFPDANFRVLTATPGDTTGFALLRIDSSQIDNILKVMANHEQITDHEVMHRTSESATVHFETTHPLLLLSAKHSGITIELPIDIQDGQASIEVTGSRSHLSELGNQLRNFGLKYDIQRIEAAPSPGKILSDRQQELLIAAVESGYYESPRQISLTALAEELGIAKSTCSEILHRAEATVIKEFLSGLPGEQIDWNAIE